MKRSTIKEILKFTSVFVIVAIFLVFIFFFLILKNQGLLALIAFITMFPSMFIVGGLFDGDNAKESFLTSLWPLGAIIGFFLIVIVAKEVIDAVEKKVKSFDNTEVIDIAVEHEKEANNTIKNNDEVKNAVLNKYDIGSKIKGYTISKPTGHCQISEFPNYSDRNKRNFLIGFNLTNGRVAYLKGVATKKDGNIKIKVEKVILE